MIVKRHIGMKIIGSIVILLGAISSLYAEKYPDQIQLEINNYLNAATQTETARCTDGISKIPAWVSEFYLKRGYFPAWIDEVGLKPEASLLLSRIRAFVKDGYSQTEYPIKVIDQLSTDAIFMNSQGSSLAPDKAAQLDIELSSAFFLHSLFLSRGRLKTPYFKGIYKPLKLPFDLPDELEHALQTKTFDTLLAQLAPPQESYHKLMTAKKRYEAIAATGGWNEIPKGPVLKEGSQDDRVILLRKRLVLTADLTDSSLENSDYFDHALKKAVQHFQKRFGLNPDGIVGSSTLDVLNVSTKDRLAQIAINLERWRQMPHDFGERYIEVNIPDFNLRVVDQGKIVQTMRVIVGRKDRPTPTFIGRMTYLELNPYWTVPPKIAKKDILPKIQNDPSFLIRKQIRVFENWKATAAELDPFSIDWNAISDENFPYRLRQEPVVSNALGQIKFMFPNKLNVYLHDTPSKELFLRRQRNFSSGCVRVENPFQLAAYLLNADDNWNPQKLRHLLDDESKKPKVILLKKPIPIYLLYWTTWVEDDNSVHFRNDIYGYDQTFLELLKKQQPVFRTCQNDSMVGYLSN